MRGGKPISSVVIRGAKSPGITHSQKFAEFEACVAAGLDVYIWQFGVLYTPEFKADVLVWYKNHCLVEIHKQDAARPKK